MYKQYSMYLGLGRERGGEEMRDGVLNFIRLVILAGKESKDQKQMRGGLLIESKLIAAL